MEAAGLGRKVCARCGQPLYRERRRVAHRLLSIVYPVCYYECSGTCGWTGLLSGDWKVRRRHILRVALVLLLALGGMASARHLAPYWNGFPP